MSGFIEEYPLKSLVDDEVDYLKRNYEIEVESLDIYYDSGSKKWVLIYDP